MSMIRRTHCRMCDEENLEQVMSLGATPPGNNFLRKEELNTPEARYPLDLYLCRTCAHVQLGHVVDPKILYQNNYPYVSAISPVFVKHLEDYAHTATKRFSLKTGDLVSDIGSNDGTCLRFFQNQGLKVVGVDPAKNLATKATAEGIETIGDFFSLSLSQSLLKKYGPAKLITSHNACAHIDQLDDVIRGVEHWLDDDGVFVVEVGYFVDVYLNLWFDTIYHEHLDYHTVGPFERLFARNGMELISGERISPQGGSIRLTAQKKGGRLKRDGSIAELIALEKKLELDQPATFRKYYERIKKTGSDLKAIISTLKKDGKSVAAFGATTKGTTLLSSFGIGDLLDYILDDNPLKQGLYSPLFHIPVLATEQLYAKQPDYVLILAWNFAEPVMKKHQRYRDQGGKFILPMPSPQIV